MTPPRRDDPDWRAAIHRLREESDEVLRDIWRRRRADRGEEHEKPPERAEDPPPEK